jgi:peroxiredoxin
MMANTQKQLEIGDAAPPIVATTASGEQFDLADWLGGHVAVWFFPRAMTPG